MVERIAFYTMLYKLKEGFYKMMYCCYLSPERLSKMYKEPSNLCLKCAQQKEHFIMIGGHVRSWKILDSNTYIDSEDVKD